MKFPEFSKFSLWPLLFLAGFFFTACNLFGPPPEPGSYRGIQSAYGGRGEIIQGFYSGFLKNSRDLRVYLPENYGSSGESYPVLYMHDGQNVFLPGGPYGCWNMETEVDTLTESGAMKPVIIVGLDNTENRALEYNQGNKGYVETYARAVVEEIIPLINRRYRTLTGPENTGVMGASFGGNASFHFARLYPQVFGAAACMSPSLWWNGAETYIDALVNQIPYFPVKLWIDAGTGEDSNPYWDSLGQMGGMAYDFSHFLLEAGWDYGKNLLFEITPGAVHNEAAWQSRVHNPLLFFFGTKTSRTPVSLKAVVLEPVLSLREEAPGTYVFGRITWDDGLEADLPMEAFTLESDFPGGHSWSRGYLKLNEDQFSGPRTLNLTIRYGGLSAGAELEVTP